MEKQFYRGKQYARRRKPWREFFVLVAVVAAPVLGMLAVADVQSDLVTVGYKMTELRDECARLKDRQVELSSELASLKRPERIWNEGRRLGLVPIGGADRIEVHIIDTDAPEVQDETLVADVGR